MVRIDGRKKFARLMDAVKTALNHEVKIEETVLWLDCKTEHFWVANCRGRKQFVHYQVNEMLRLISKEQWRHSLVR